MTLLVENRPLLLKFREGDPAALRIVFEHYGPIVTALLRGGFSFQAGEQRVRFGGFERIFDLEDILQEVFRRAFSDGARQSYDGLRPYKAYLGAITRNAVINDYQAKRRQLDRYQIEVDAAESDDWSAAHDPMVAHGAVTGQPHRDLEAAELRTLIQGFRDDLTGREREVFRLRFEEGLSHTQIEAQSGLSASKIKTSEARIKKALLRHVKRHGYLRGEGSSTRSSSWSDGRATVEIPGEKS